MGAMKSASQQIDTGISGPASAINAEAGAAAPKLNESSRDRATEERSRRWREERQAKMAAMTEEEFEAYGREIASVW